MVVDRVIRSVVCITPGRSHMPGHSGQNPDIHPGYDQITIRVHSQMVGHGIEPGCTTPNCPTSQSGRDNCMGGNVLYGTMPIHWAFTSESPIAPCNHNFDLPLLCKDPESVVPTL
jgi:hypothetical protein